MPNMNALYSLGIPRNPPYNFCPTIRLKLKAETGTTANQVFFLSIAV